jgi:hypothetical protein
MAAATRRESIKMRVDGGTIPALRRTQKWTDGPKAVLFEKLYLAGTSLASRSALGLFAGQSPLSLRCGD